jgi:diguanylate cyclase (GGDEF)-like protein/PAS domain S-box-containing protein
LDVSQTPRDISLCGHALLQGQPFVINDARGDPRFADNPLVTGAPFIRFYAGVPLFSIEHQAVGTFCVLDSKPRTLTERELTTLIDLARMAEELFQRRQLSIASNKILESLRESEERYRQLVEHSPDAILISDGSVITYINQAGVLLLGAERSEQIVNLPIYAIVAPEFRAMVRQRINFALRTLRSNPSHELQWVRLDGTLVDVEVSTTSFTKNGRPAFQVIARDDTMRKLSRDELEHLATHDALTGLPNRVLLRDRLTQSIARWARHKQEATIAFLDLDHFKDINDTFGHNVGDQVLIEVSRVMRQAVRGNDTVARIGGDEFVLILDSTGDEDPHVALQRLFVDMSRPISTYALEITVSCSIGYCRYPADGITADSLLNAADSAMYRAKHLGRSNINAYTPEMQSIASERMTMESSLRLALKRDELILHYQPKINLQTGAVVGVEALVRWQHPELGLMSPMRFIPVAEETGLIVPMGDWILRTACEQAVLWQRMGIPNMPVAVNLSARQFLQPHLVAWVKEIIEATGIEPQLLELELTESLSIGSPEKGVVVLKALKELGVTLTLDDFGTGYSNLTYLKRFPLDKLKLDQSFVRDITHSNDALVISQGIITLAHGLHLTVVAEGVETQEQLNLLRQHQCDEMQGYFLSKPLPARQCTDFLQTTEHFGRSAVDRTASQHTA